MNVLTVTTVILKCLIGIDNYHKLLGFHVPFMEDWSTYSQAISVATYSSCPTSHQRPFMETVISPPPPSFPQSARQSNIWNFPICSMQSRVGIPASVDYMYSIFFAFYNIYVPAMWSFSFGRSPTYFASKLDSSILFRTSSRFNAMDIKSFFSHAILIQFGYWFCQFIFLCSSRTVLHVTLGIFNGRRLHIWHL